VSSGIGGARHETIGIRCRGFFLLAIVYVTLICTATTARSNQIREDAGDTQ